MALMERFSKDASSRVEAAAMSTFGMDTLINIVPRNPIRAAADTDMLGVIFFGLMFGAALTLIPAAKAKPMIDVLEALNAVVTAIIHFAMLFAPFGVAALIFTVSSRFGFDLLIAVAAFVATVLRRAARCTWASRCRRSSGSSSACRRCCSSRASARR